MKTAFDIELIQSYAYDTLIAIIVIALILMALYIINFFTQKLKGQLMKLNLKSLKIFGLEIINVGKQELIIASMVNGLQLIVSLSFLYLALVAILSEIPATEDISDQLVALIFEPLEVLFNSLISYLPKLFSIIITIIVAKYLMKAVKYIVNGVVKGNFHFPGFHPRTARTTGGIITFLIYVLTIIVILPSMPGYESLAFKGIATFLGALITIGGSSVIANYMAGIVLTYMHAFEKGDWVTIAETFGQVAATGAFAVRLDSFKGEEINIPNAKILGSAIRNHTGKDKEKIILHTEISIGYDVSWKKVHTLLVNAANRTVLLDSTQEPLILQKKLDDFYVVYELNVGLSHPELKPKALSQLHANILDVFNEAEIEIMSPHYRAERDGAEATIPLKDNQSIDDQKD